jgi:hypothetical protein
MKICQKFVRIRDLDYIEEFWNEDFVFIILNYLFVNFFFNLGFFLPIKHCLGIYFILGLC